MSEPLVAYFLRFLRDPREVESSLVGPVLLLKAETNGDQGRNTMTLSASARSNGSPNDPVVLELRKRPNSSFQRGITVGRSPEADLVLQSPSVSRLHAWFSIDPIKRQWMVVDAESKNGTAVNGNTLSPNRPEPLPGPAVIHFGSLKAEFLPIADFLQLLKSRSSAASNR